MQCCAAGHYVFMRRRGRCAHEVDLEHGDELLDGLDHALGGVGAGADARGARHPVLRLVHRRPRPHQILAREQRVIWCCFNPSSAGATADMYKAFTNIVLCRLDLC